MAPDGPLSSVNLWGDEQFSDAMVVLGDKTWKVHRWVVCIGSEYFLTALEGEFKEAKTKTVVLTMDEHFTVDDINDFLHFLYTNELSSRQQSDPLATFKVADYFQAHKLRGYSIVALRNGLKQLVEKCHWRNYRKHAFKLLNGEPAGGDLEKVLVEVTAQHVPAILHESGTWDEIADAYPAFANKILKAIVPKPQPVQPAQAMPHRTSMAYDHLHRPAHGQGGGAPGSSRRGLC